VLVFEVVKEVFLGTNKHFQHVACLVLSEASNISGCLHVFEATRPPDYPELLSVKPRFKRHSFVRP
jgi:hypothetical protein